MAQAFWETASLETWKFCHDQDPQQVSSQGWSYPRPQHTLMQTPSNLLLHYQDYFAQNFMSIHSSSHGVRSKLFLCKGTLKWSTSTCISCSPQRSSKFLFATGQLWRLVRDAAARKNRICTQTLKSLVEKSQWGINHRFLQLVKWISVAIFTLEF